MVSFLFSIIFVASNLPPRPVSKILMSLGNRLKAINAAAVVISKNVIGLRSFLNSTSSKILIKLLSEINFWFILIRSLKFIK